MTQKKERLVIIPLLLGITAKSRRKAERNLLTPPHQSVFVFHYVAAAAPLAPKDSVVIFFPLNTELNIAIVQVNHI